MRWFMQNPPDEGEEVRWTMSRLAASASRLPGQKRANCCRRSATRMSADMKFMDVRELDIGTSEQWSSGSAIPAIWDMRFTCPQTNSARFIAALAEAGEPFGMKPFGMRAMMSLRLEKGFGSWGREFRPDYMPGETGMDRFISWKKNVDFIGRAAAEKERADGPARKLCTFIVESDPTDMDAGRCLGR